MSGVLRPFDSNGARDPSNRFPYVGELIFVRLPHNVPGASSAISSSALSGANGTNYHLCLVCCVSRSGGVKAGGGSGALWAMQVIVGRSYSTLQDPIGYVRSLPTEHFNRLLPLPHNPPLETPAGFGSQISMHVTRTLARPTWLIAEIVDVSMGANSAVSYHATLGYE